MYVRGMGLFLLLLTWVQVAFGQTLEREFKGWRVYTLQRDGQKTCYLSSSPTDKTGSAKRRGEPYFLVTYRGQQISEISVSAGYAYLPKSSVTLAIDGKQTYALFTSEQTPEIAWARDAAEDRKIVEGMSTGGRVTVAAKGQKKAASTDAYALSGFAEAHRHMQELCEKAPDKGAKPARAQQAVSVGKQTKDSTASASKAKDAKASAGQAKDAKASASQAKDAKTSASKARDAKTSASKAKDAKTSASKARDAKTSASKARDSKTSTSQVRDPKASTGKAKDSKVSPTRDQDTKNR